MSGDDVKHDGLRKIAFVAMPFGVKPTGNPPGKPPSKVDYDTLWAESIKPALIKLGYYAVRADEQSGSVIVKDMLAQLVHADLVIADISAPNGNVYYEAGVRHAVKSTGCILINASWARPLFDLRQITYLSYPLDTDKPDKKTYTDIQDALLKGVPALADAVGPVFELAAPDSADDSTSHQLSEQAKSLFDFDVKLRNAAILASSGTRSDRSKLRALIADENLGDLPSYAIKDLVIEVRDHLNWGELLALFHKLPEEIRNKSWFIEQEALAEGKLGNISKAIALIEQVIERDGPTTDRYGNIGSRYRELARAHPGELDENALNKAIKAYETGLELDLNDYYCAHKLLVAYVERGRSRDDKRAQQCAIHVSIACQRATKQNPNDEWLTPTRLILAFYNRDVEKSEILVDEILDRGWTNWKLVGLLTDLKAMFGVSVDGKIEQSHDDTQESLLNMVKEIEKQLPVAQSILLKSLLPQIKTEAPLYKKFKAVDARLGILNEVIVSVTSDGDEGHNIVKEGDIVARNLTKAGEMYIIPGKKFHGLYIVENEPSSEWQRYQPAGEVHALEVTHAVTTLLGVGNRFFIEAPWGESQFCAEGDYFVSPAPAFDEIYRIAKAEFHETYVLKEEV